MEQLFSSLTSSSENYRITGTAFFSEARESSQHSRLAGSPRGISLRVKSLVGARTTEEVGPPKGALVVERCRYCRKHGTWAKSEKGERTHSPPPPSLWSAEVNLPGQRRVENRHESEKTKSDQQVYHCLFTLGQRQSQLIQRRSTVSHSLFSRPIFFPFRLEASS